MYKRQVKFPVIVLLTQLPPVTIWYLYWTVGVVNVVEATIEPEINTCVPVTEYPKPVGKLLIEGPPLAEYVTVNDSPIAPPPIS